jgi:hypothetical protein
MEERSFEIIHIEWKESTIRVADAFADPERVLRKYGNGGLYQIYGHSPIYGPDALLYIGITNDFNIRMDQHLRAILQRGLNLRFVFGTTDFPDLEVPESILINLHKPCLNKEFLHSISLDAMKRYYMVLNKGNRGALMLECSNVWWEIQQPG